jgi:hypothetical protein
MLTLSFPVMQPNHSLLVATRRIKHLQTSGGDPTTHEILKRALIGWLHSSGTNFRGGVTTAPSASLRIFIGKFNYGPPRTSCNLKILSRGFLKIVLCHKHVTNWKYIKLLYIILNANKLETHAITCYT